MTSVMASRSGLSTTNTGFRTFIGRESVVREIDSSLHRAVVSLFDSGLIQRHHGLTEFGEVVKMV